MLAQKGFVATLRTNWAVAKEQPLIVVMGGLNTLLPVCLLLCGAAVLTQLTGTASHGLSLIGTCAIAVALLFWAMTTGVGAKLFAMQIKVQHNLDELLGMTEALQSAESYEDTATVLASTSLELLPEFGGALYVFNNSRDRLDLVGSWCIPEDYKLAETLSPGNCWTLKRGKTQVNRPTSTKLRCAHHTGPSTTLEVPMIARGAVYGLLIFVGDESEHVLKEFSAAARLAQAMADAMSLALSNISLREKLRTQSLRDPLTGLYNRRYMEDALERFVSLAERSGAPTSVLMFDLDNFKRLNDEFGHAKGDAVLRDVAAQIVGGVRPSDVICRYGGEEIIAILPDCPLDDAKLKAEALRLRIEGLSEVHGVAVSSSIGVATIPQTSTTVADLVAMADGALYAAKTGGKNRVVCAKLRAGPAAKPAALAA
jgi:diguanylate cyclase (GGDEF)-like protein